MKVFDIVEILHAARTVLYVVTYAIAVEMTLISGLIVVVTAVALMSVAVMLERTVRYEVCVVGNKTVAVEAWITGTRTVDSVVINCG